MPNQIPPIMSDIFTRPVSELRKQNNIVQVFIERCETAIFTKFTGVAGLVDATFERSSYLCEGNVVFDRFREACKTLPEVAKLTIAFHGTPEENIPKILSKGLDLAKRSGQAYGPGEYFSTDPGVSTGYCRGGKKMLVFLVVPPLTRATPMPQMFGNCPHHYIVVPTTEHQLPLGVLKFDRVEAEALRRANDLRTRLQVLHDQVRAKDSEATMARIKAKIIQKLITAGVDVAGEVYIRNSEYLDDKSKKEISAFAHLKYDEDFLVFYFPDLPPPPTSHELEGVTVEALEDELASKKKELAEEVAKYQIKA